MTITRVEHVLPQTPEASSQWTKDFDERSREKWINKISNLLLLSTSKNSSLGRLDFLKKKKKYLEGRISPFPRSREILDYPSWDVSTLEKRQKEIVDKLISAY